MAIIVDVLAGLLSGAGCCRDVNAPLAGDTDGVLIIAIRVEAFCQRDWFEHAIDALVRHMKSSPPAPGFDAVLLPGELEAANRRLRRAEGISVELTVWRMLEETAESVGMPPGGLFRQSGSTGKPRENEPLY